MFPPTIVGLNIGYLEPLLQLNDYISETLISSRYPLDGNVNYHSRYAHICTYMSIFVWIRSLG